MSSFPILLLSWCDNLTYRIIFLNVCHACPLFIAGCYDLDSDGDRKVDDCEDRYPPNIVLRNAEIFRCDDDDTSRLCYDDKWFNSQKQVRNFLGYHFPAADDCAPTKKLSVKIEHDHGSCHNTTYTLEPIQNYSECNDRDDVKVGIFTIPFQNPLPGASKTVTVQLDEVAPVIECGFHPDNTTINKVEGKTLYHYMLRNEASKMRMRDAGFFYKVTVRTDVRCGLSRWVFQRKC